VLKLAAVRSFRWGEVTALQPLREVPALASAQKQSLGIQRAAVDEPFDLSAPWARPDRRRMPGARPAKRAGP